MLAGVPEDLLPIFLQARTNWQLVMHTVTEGLQLAYMLARSDEFEHLVESGKFGSDFQKTNSPAAAAIIAVPPQSKIKDKLVAGIECKVVAHIVDALVPAVESMIISVFMHTDYNHKTTVRFGIENKCVEISVKPMACTNEFTSSKTGQGTIILGTTSHLQQTATSLQLLDANDLGSNLSKAIDILSMTSRLIDGLPGNKTLFSVLMTNAIEIRELINRPELEYIMKTLAPLNAPEDIVIQIVACLVFMTYLEDGEGLANKVAILYFQSPVNHRLVFRHISGHDLHKLKEEVIEMAGQ
ncbi:uncharacterized protein F5891DRAFT_984020 [Suillus fuscotomentosus]|uniref:Uncharacterized protein n=1 Tax=Suillus fuscotomentosus TaxID=1912939 RepID=A0AAD4DX32_9AGAM|nr:uncharacterized protein F5891DRAFT_984020 [Suillus fuscotomentosus]KAG1895716.1 hypothetical protein F5891DRAFT_984020 [Suillus fuscotomentosus]